jgi:hypothetical protein
MGATKLNNYSSDVIRNSELGKAIAAPARIIILRLIYENSYITGPELLKATIYQHIGTLVQSGLIIGLYEENLYCWKLNPDTAADFEKIKWVLDSQKM